MAIAWLKTQNSSIDFTFCDRRRCKDGCKCSLDDGYARNHCGECVLEEGTSCNQQQDHHHHDIGSCTCFATCNLDMFNMDTIKMSTRSCNADI